MTWWAVGVGAATSIYSASKSGSKQKTGPDKEDIGRARKLFSKYMDYAQEGLFQIADTGNKNRKKSADNLFQLQNVGESMRQNALRVGYNNAQGRLGQTNQAMRSAILGTPDNSGFMDQREIPVNLSHLQKLAAPELQGLPQISNPQNSEGVLAPPNQLTPEEEEQAIINRMQQAGI